MSSEERVGRREGAGKRKVGGVRVGVCVRLAVAVTAIEGRHGKEERAITAVVWGRQRVQPSINKGWGGGQIEGLGLGLCRE